MDENIKIHIKIKNLGPLLANADISILSEGFGWVSIKDFIIWDSNIVNSRLNANINIQPLSANVHGKFIKKVFIENSASWEKMEKEIYGAYLKKQLEAVPIEIPDEIPF